MEKAKVYLETIVWHIVIAGLGYVPTLSSIEWMRSKGIYGPLFVVGVCAVYAMVTLIIANLFAIPTIRFKIWRLGVPLEGAERTYLSTILWYWLSASTTAAAILFICLFFGRKFV